MVTNVDRRFGFEFVVSLLERVLSFESNSITFFFFYTDFFILDFNKTELDKIVFIFVVWCDISVYIMYFAV